MFFAYASWCEFKGFSYEYQKYSTIKELPFIPLEKDIDQLIGIFSDSKYGALLQLFKETAFRPSEGMNLRVKDVDLERGIITLNNPLKNSNPRQVKISARLVAMLMPLLKGKKLDDKIWKTKSKSISRTYVRLRNKASEKLCNTNLKRITMKTFRHWKATMEYHKTKDILYVQSLLGHKAIQNTLVYTHLVQWESQDNFTCRIAKTIEEAQELIESDFEFITQFEGKMMFRKRK